MVLLIKTLGPLNLPYGFYFLFSLPLYFFTYGNLKYFSIYIWYRSYLGKYSSWVLSRAYSPCLSSRFLHSVYLTPLHFLAKSTLRFVGQSLTSAILVLMPSLISVISLSTGCASWFHSQPMLWLILGSIWIDLDVWFPSRFLHGDISQIELDINDFFIHGSQRFGYSRIVLDLCDFFIHGLCLIFAFTDPSSLCDLCHELFVSAIAYEPIFSLWSISAITYRPQISLWSLLIVTSAILGSQLSPWFGLGDLCDFVIWWSLVASMTLTVIPHGFCLISAICIFHGLYLSTYFCNWSLCKSAYDLSLQFYLCVIYYGLTSLSVPAVYLSVSPFRFYLYVLGSFS